MRPSEITGAPITIKLPARLENLPRLIAPVLASARALKLGEERCLDLELALEESLVNIYNYAYSQEPGSIEVSSRVENDRLVVLIEDEGIAFSAAAAKDPDLSSVVSARKVGGLGIYLIRSLMDDVRYRREGNRNLLELTVCIEPEEISK